MFEACMIGAAISATAATYLAYTESPSYRYAKPLPLLFLLFALTVLKPSISAWLILYYVASWCGDVFLLNKKHGFMWGLAAFLSAHVVLLGLLLSRQPFATDVYVLMLCASGAMAGWFVHQLHIGRGWLKGAVYFYAIVLMALFCVSLMLTVRGDDHWQYAGVWAMLFVLSDAALAINRFRYAFRFAQLIILPTYFISQMGWTWLWATEITKTF